MEPHPITLPFKQAYCARYQCSPGQFRSKLFWRSLYWHARPLALWLYLVQRHYFKRDFELIEQVGRATTGQEIQDALEMYASFNYNSLSFLRGKVRVRISGRRVFNLWKKVRRHESQFTPRPNAMLQEVAKA